LTCDFNKSVVGLNLGSVGLISLTLL